MKPMDWNASAAWIALAISIITPTISLLLNNLHQRKLKRLELRHQKNGVLSKAKRGVQEFPKMFRFSPSLY